MTLGLSVDKIIVCIIRAVPQLMPANGLQSLKSHYSGLVSQPGLDSAVLYRSFKHESL